MIGFKDDTSERELFVGLHFNIFYSLRRGSNHTMASALTLDDFHSKIYHDTDYNCSHFVRDLWLFLTNQDIYDLVHAWNARNLQMAMRHRVGLQRLQMPTDPCIVLFHKHGDPPHSGVYLEGMVFHMTTDGPRLQDLGFVSLSFDSAKFYLCNTK